jgi:quercetin dioxygenase-like cupin family protein
MKGNKLSHIRVRLTKNSLRCLTPLVAALLSVAFPPQPPTVSAAPTAGVSAVVHSKQTVNGKDYIVSDVTIAPGGSTGWHTHQGQIFGIVKAGTLTHNVADCSQDGVYTAGEPITDPTGADHVHIGRNLGTTPVVLEVLYVDAAGAPTSDSMPNPGCEFS